jgi:hypothetical protein
MLSHSVPDQKSQYIKTKWASRFKRGNTVPNPLQRKKSIQVFSCIHAEMICSRNMYEPHALENIQNQYR